MHEFLGAQIIFSALLFTIYIYARAKVGFITGKKPTKTVLFSYARGLLENQDFLSFESYVTTASKNHV